MGQPREKSKDLEFEATFADELEPGHELMHGQYVIEAFLNAGGFGITYIARDSLGRKVVIKECFPGSFCRRSTSEAVQPRSRAHQRELSKIVDGFVREAHSLAKLSHPNIVGVHHVFEECNTAYMALDFIEGKDLLDMIENPTEPLDPEKVEKILRQILSAMQHIHGQSLLHRDISPDNIIVRPNGEPVLIDFGAAREDEGPKSRPLSALRVVKDGYSPQEFYIAGSRQGPFSDLYAIGATFYHLITGELPANSQARLAAIASGEKDVYDPVANRMPEYSDRFLRAIDKAMQILPKDRLQTADEWLQLLDGEAVPSPETLVAADTSIAASAEAGSGNGKLLLLGGAAAIALLAGGAYVVSSGALSDTDDVAAAVPEDSAALDASVVARPTELSAEEVSAPSAEPTDVALAPATSPVSEPVEAIIEPAPVSPSEAIVEEAAAEVASTVGPSSATLVASVTRPPLPTAVPAFNPDLKHPDATQFLVPTAAVSPADQDLTKTFDESPEPVVVEETAVQAVPAVVQQSPANVFSNIGELSAPTTDTLDVNIALAVAQVLPKGPVASSPIPRARPTEAGPRALGLIEVSAGFADPEPTILPFQPEPVRVTINGFATLETSAQAEAFNAAMPPLQTVSVSPGDQLRSVGLDSIRIAAAQGRDFPPNDLDQIVLAPAPIETVAPAAPEQSQLAAAAEGSYDLDGVMTAWFVKLPFPDIFNARSGETQLFAVNGQTISNETEFNAVLRETVQTPAEPFIDIDVLVGASRQTARVQTWTVPVYQITAFLSGLTFETTYENEWRTRVASVPASLESQLEEGEIVAGDLSLNQVFDSRTSVPDLLVKAQDQGANVLTLAVQQDGKLSAVKIINPSMR